jgi:hypothetical protein
MTDPDEASMPWMVDRTADTVLLSMAIPMTDWEGLMRYLPSKLSPPPKRVFLPASIEGGSEHDAKMLQGLWIFLLEAGVPTQHEVLASPGTFRHPHR